MKRFSAMNRNAPESVITVKLLPDTGMIERQNRMIGKTLKHYKIEERIGRGGMGVVYKARDVRLGRPVALKVLKDEVMDDPDRKRRFLQEARSASAVTHPAIAQVYDVDEVDGMLFLAMEFVEGQTVGQLIANRELDLLGAVEIALQITEGIGRAHSVGIVHRDIKSDNIMFTPDGHSKILDFGLAKLLDPSRNDSSGVSVMETMAKTQAGTVMGTVAYMSPEQARGRDIDHRSDLFSIGVVLYEMVTGELPFKGQSPLDTMHAIAFEEVRPVTVLRKDLPPELQRVISRCMRKRPEDRYQDAASLTEDLKRLKNHLESGSQPTVTLRDRVQDALEWARFSMPLGTVGIVVAVLVTAFLAVLFFYKMDVATVVVLLILGIPLYRYIRNRKIRTVRKFVAKASRIPEVQIICVQGDLITVVVDRSTAALLLRLNGYVENVNSKLLYGDPLELSVRDDLDPVKIQQILREPGVRYVRENVLASQAPVP